MPTGHWHIEWLNENSQRSYPFTEAATQTDSSGDFVIPDDFILALKLPVHAGLDVLPDRFFVHKIAIFGTGFSISIAYDDGTSNYPIVGTAQIARATHEEYDSYALPGKNDFADTVGEIAIGRLDTIDTLAPGQYVFTPAGGALDADAIDPMIQFVSALVLRNGAEVSDRLQGDIEITAGNNISLTAIVIPGQRPVIRIDAIDGSGLNEECICDDESQGPCIRSINGITPTVAGDYTILGSTCLDVDAITNGLKLVDICSEPCCGCTELTALTQELMLFGTAATTVRGFVNRLQSEVTTFHQTILGSLLSDEGCQACTIEV